jgi:hypothetical protein
MSDIHSPEYRPSNVTIQTSTELRFGKPTTIFTVIDFDGTPMQTFTSREDAESRRRNRAGVIRAALTRRANKSRKGI